ncbi:MAG TPA: serine/threonine-protein kinase [Polyangiaceae bacterium]|nr:serine/threonine-protein kinase [Polyangiaceae bacterium]
MKACAGCGRLFSDEDGFCPVDGQPLRELDQVAVPTRADDPRVGATVAGRYQLWRVVADGGMGRVYEALDRAARRRVAVKMLHEEVARDEVSVERFKREFEVSKDLPHQHIVEVIDFQQEGGTYALVMEFLDGEELRAVLQREKTISPGRAVRMVSQLAIGLEPAHQKGFIHRDLKPDNVFLCGTREGDSVKLLDFGSVKDTSYNAKKLTVLGMTIGSPFYMAPEQAQGLETLDRRADVWAVAAIVYESLTGEVPFVGTNGPTILLAILTKEPVPPSAVAKANGKDAIPPALDAVIAKALAKNPNNRTTTVADFAVGLGRAYGLEGEVATWAQTPQAALDEQITRALPSLLAAPPPAPVAIADPFAAAPVPPAAPPPPPANPFADPTAPPAAAPADAAAKAAPSAPAMPAAPAAPSAELDRAFAAPQQPAYQGDDEEYSLPAGVPGASPRWVVPAVVGALFLVVGGALAMALLR